MAIRASWGPKALAEFFLRVAVGPGNMPTRPTSWRLTGTCALVMAIAASPGTPAATILVVAERDGDAVDVHASADLNADRATVWRVLTDYDRYAAFIPDLHRSRVISRHASVVTVEQSGDAYLWLLRLPIEVTFEIDESPPNRLESHAVAGSLRALTSRYELTPVAAGMRLDYFGRIAPGFALLGPFEKAAVEQNIARQFQAFADEIERQAAAAHSGASTPLYNH